MTNMKNLIARFVRDEQGQDLIEYALLAGFISLAVVTAVTNVGTVAEHALRQRQYARSTTPPRSLSHAAGPATAASRCGDRYPRREENLMSWLRH